MAAIVTFNMEHFWTVEPNLKTQLFWNLPTSGKQDIIFNYLLIFMHFKSFITPWRAVVKKEIKILYYD